MSKIEEFSRLYDALGVDSQEALMWALSLVSKLRSASGEEVVLEKNAPAAPAISNKKAAARERLRADINRHIWESDLKSELLDRAIALVDAGVVSTKELKAAVLTSERKPIDLGDGNPRRWVSFARAVKRWYTRTSEPWTPCSDVYEPRPAA